MTKTNQIIMIFIVSIMSLASQPYSYEYQYNDGAGNRTQLLSNVGCNIFCGCPEDKEDWFTLTSEVGGLGSSCPNGCIIFRSPSAKPTIGYPPYWNRPYPHENPHIHVQEKINGN